MRTLTRSFAQGLLVLAPVAITVWVVVFTITTLDRWLDTSIPGLGIVIAAAGITVIGYLAGNVVGNKLFSWLESGMRRVPLIRILYDSLRDLFGAFVGSKRKFDKPVAVEINAHGLKVLGFLTNEHFDDPHLAGPRLGVLARVVQLRRQPDRRPRRPRPSARRRRSGVHGIHRVRRSDRHECGKNSGRRADGLNGEPFAFRNTGTGAE